MTFKEIQNKGAYLKKHYPFLKVPKLKEKLYCLHCNNDILVGDYKVELSNGEEYIVCPNAPKCDGTVIDWMPLGFGGQR